MHHKLKLFKVSSQQKSQIGGGEGVLSSYLNGYEHVFVWFSVYSQS